MRQERWLFLFEAIIAACALAAFFRIDISTVASLFGAATLNGAPATYTFRDGIISTLLFISLICGCLGVYLTKGENVPRLSRRQQLILLDKASKIRTLMSNINIACTNGNRATEPLAHDLADIFNRAGIDPRVLHTRPDNSAQSGIILCIRDLNHPPPATEDIKSILGSAKIRFTVSGFPTRGFVGIDDYPDNNLVIWVAPKPL